MINMYKTEYGFLCLLLTINKLYTYIHTYIHTTLTELKLSSSNHCFRGNRGMMNEQMVDS